MKRISVLGCGLTLAALAACGSPKQQADTTGALTRAPDTVKPAATDTTKKATPAPTAKTKTTAKTATTTESAAGTKSATKKDSIIGRDSVIKRPPIRLPVVKKPPQ